jgi:uncharacterized protein YbjT (DUF2867 family)
MRNENNKNRVLVIGATGGIGRQVVRELHSQANGIEVVATVRNKEKAEAPIARHVFKAM